MVEFAWSLSDNTSISTYPCSVLEKHRPVYIWLKLETFLRERMRGRQLAGYGSSFPRWQEVSRLLTDDDLDRGLALPGHVQGQTKFPTSKGK